MEINDLFDYGFKICQNDNYFKFSIDSVLLSEFVNYKKGNRIIDLCSGNCPIPLILTAKYGSRADIEAIEIQQEIYELGKKSIEINDLNNINYHLGDVLELNKIFPKNSFDIVTCNPPYYEYLNEENISNDYVKSIARHEIKLKLEDMIKISADLLRNNGKLYFVHVPYRLSEIILLLNKYNFGLKRIVPVYGNDNVNASFILFESVKNAKNYVKILPAVNVKAYESYKGIFDEVKK